MLEQNLNSNTGSDKKDCKPHQGERQTAQNGANKDKFFGTTMVAASPVAVENHHKTYLETAPVQLLHDREEEHDNLSAAGGPRSIPLLGRCFQSCVPRTTSPMGRCFQSGGPISTPHTGRCFQSSKNSTKTPIIKNHMTQNDIT